MLSLLKHIMAFRRIVESGETVVSDDLITAVNTQTRVLHRAIKEQMHLMHFLSLPNKTITFPFLGAEVSLYVPNGDVDAVQRHIVRGQSFYETPILRRVLDIFDFTGKRVLDIGGNIGNHSVFFTKIGGAASCIAFEPNPYPISIFKENIRLNGLEGVIDLRQMAISDAPGKLTFDKYRLDNIGGTSYKESESGTIAAVRLDDVDVGHVDFIKIDVEGMASKVLGGARSTITSNKPMIFIEIFETEMPECSALLESMNYVQHEDLGGSNYIYMPA